MPDDYSLQKHIYYTAETKKVIDNDLPPFCADYFRALVSQTSALTRYVYALDLRMFFNYIVNSKNDFANSNITPKQLTPKMMESISALDIELFLEYVSLYERETVSQNEDGTQSVKSKLTVNMNCGKARKLSSIRSLFKYLYKHEYISSSPASIVDTPKIHDKPIIRLEEYEIDRLYDVITNAEGMTPVQKKHLERNRTRDIAIITLFLGTGIRISELVGIDLDDINFVSDEFSVTRKGGKKDVLVFGEEVRMALLNYIAERELTEAVEGHENALFLSSQRRRITVRAVEKLVKKYAEIAVPQKHITPHKLRSTYGTMLYGETGDIYLVADVLGHRDVNTTRKHYAEVAKARRRLAAEVIKIHGDKPFDDESSDNSDKKLSE